MSVCVVAVAGTLGSPTEIYFDFEYVPLDGLNVRLSDWTELSSIASCEPDVTVKCYVRVL